MKLAKSVAVNNPETHQTHWFHPGDQPPAWAAELITNPACWEQSGGQSAPQPEEDIVDTIDYSKLRIVDLDELLEERDLPLTGSKKDKAERLQAHDDTLK